MKPDISRLRVAGLTASAVTLVLALGGVGLAAGSSLTLELKGQYAKRHRTACHKSKHFRFFHRRSTVEARGFLTPAPAGHFAVRLQLEQCVRGSWRHLNDRSILGKKVTGKYKGFFSARPLAPRSHKAKAVNYYFGRTFAGGLESTKEYFAVTN